MYNPLHPAVLRMLKHLADVSRENRVRLFMCGEMAGDPVHTPILLGLGIEELSMNPQAIPAVKSMIRSITSESARLFLDEVLRQGTVAEVARLVRETYGSILAKKVYKE
jgi:phosphoenolpyruvate-protein phosphotransferase (PTS system enzyme I)